MGDTINSYEYNGLGQRTATSVDGVTVCYALDGSIGLTAGVAGGPSASLRASLPEVIVATVGGASTRYVQMGGQILAEDEAGAWAYVLPDALGSVRPGIDAAGQVSLAQGYDPFGNLSSQHGTPNSQLPFGYIPLRAQAGEQEDAGTELLFLRARYHDPAVGRFVSKDPWPGISGLPVSFHSHLYASDNPVMHVDLLGLYDCTTWPSVLRPMCQLLDDSSAARLAAYRTMQIGLHRKWAHHHQSMASH